MHEHLIKWLSEKKKKIERGVPHKLAPRRGCLDYSKVYCDVRKRWFLTWNQNSHITITYSIFSILIPKSVLVFFTLARTSLDDPDLIIARLWSVRNLPTSILVRASVSLLTFLPYAYANHSGAIMVYKFRELQIPKPFHFNAVLSC